MYVVVGANGYLGSYVIKAILENTMDDVIATARNIVRATKQDKVTWYKCDIQNDGDIDTLIDKLSGLDNLKIVYLAAYHQPDIVEKNKSMAWDINVTSLSKFVNKLNNDCKFYYASTDSVYGESEDEYHYKENNALNPVNCYGHNKCAAEAIVIHSGYNVVRFPFLISPSLIYKKHFYDEIVEKVRNGEQMEMFSDSYRSSLSFDNAARLLIMLMESNKAIPHVVNVCGDRDLSKYDVGQMIAKREHLDPDLIVPTLMSSGKGTVNKFKTKRATSTLMDNALLKSILNLDYIDIFELPN